ncbi:YbaB/EbfC family nucleoid-associated protein [Acidiferrimicrobium sp. IK]|uniref:YbaB/EbfC family nucleoid-associated protein n=1 Tax=Acidiferrimicrobium sp. IK TaxID=2871700 RepID=UPI003966BAE7
MSVEGPGGQSGVPDLGALLSQVGQMQQNLAAAQQQAAETVVEGSAGGGAVRVEVTGGLDFQSVTIDPSVVDPADVEMLQDLVLAALRAAVEAAQSLQADALGDVGFGDGLGGIQGLLGG